MSISSSVVNERRVFDRFPARYPAKIKDSRYQYGQKVSLRNASAEGSALITKDKFYLNDSLTLEVKLPDKDFPMTIKGQVIWVKDGSAGMWEVGLKFHDIDLVYMSRLYELHEPIHRS
jgi:Tfp pilus assembly protein PilZ